MNDLQTEVNLDQRKFFSLLSVGWGLLSDIDIESEVLRYIGEIRFFIWSFIRLIQLRRYKAELSYVPYDSKESITSRVFVNDDFVSVYSACQSHIGSDMLFAPDAESLDSTIHLTYLPSNTGRLACAKFLHELNRGREEGKSFMTYDRSVFIVINVYGILLLFNGNSVFLY